MEAVTTTVRVPRAARFLAAISLATCITALILDPGDIALAAGLALAALFALAAVIAYLLAPRRTVVLLDIQGDQLLVTSRTDPARMEIGRLYEESTSVPIDSIRKLVMRLVYLGRWGDFVDITVTTEGGATQNMFFPGELRDEVKAFLSQLRQAFPNIALVDGGYHTRITWRSWKDILRPRALQRHK